MFPLELEIKKDDNTYNFTIYDRGISGYGLEIEKGSSTLFKCKGVYLSSTEYGFNSNRTRWNASQWQDSMQDFCTTYINYLVFLNH